MTSGQLCLFVGGGVPCDFRLLPVSPSLSATASADGDLNLPHRPPLLIVSY